MVDYKLLAIVLAFQAPFICVIICVYYFCTLGRNGYTRIQHFMAKALAIACLGCMATEVFCGLVNYGLIEGDKSLYPWSSLVGYMFMLSFAVLWGEFSLSRAHNPSKVLSILVRAMYFVVFVILTARIAFMDTKVFSYYEDGTLKYGPLDDIQTYACSIIYILLLIAYIRKCADKREYAYKEVHGKLLFADSIILVAIVIYETVYYPYILWIGYMLVLLYIYMSNQRSSIYKDELTHLYNRRSLIKDLNDRMKEENRWSLILIDVNRFKQINDTYGHSEGDRALEKVASVISDVAKLNNATSYRYGGDEFVIVYDNYDEVELKRLCRDLDEEFEKCSEADNLPYVLSISSGYAIYEENTMSTIPDIMEEADKRMYEDKVIKKSESEKNEAT